jgi:hypothetical protein
MADGFLGGLSDFAGGVGDFFTGGGVYGDPKNINQRYGVPEADVRQAGLGALGNVGALLLAAGQSPDRGQRAQFLGQLGGAVSGMNTDIYKSSQARLMNAQQQQARQEMEELSAIDQRRKSDPTGLAREMNLPEQAIRALPAKDLRELAKKIIIQQATVDPATRALQAASAAVPPIGSAAPGASAEAGVPSQQAAATAGIAPQISQSLMSSLSPEARRTVEVYQTALNDPRIQSNPAKVKELLENIDRLVPGAKEASAAKGKALGAQEAAAPLAYSQAGEMIKLIDATATHPGREMGTGVSAFMSNLPGAASMGARDFSNYVKQLQGKTFLEAYETLKGTGQITEVEGAKATQAISRIGDPYVEEKDYLKALKDLRDVVENTRERLSGKLGTKYEASQVPDVYKTLGGSSSTSPAQPTTRVRRFNPATGKIED